MPPLVAKINRERRNSKNYVLFLGATDAETNQAPCLSLVQFQIDDGNLVVVYGKGVLILSRDLSTVKDIYRLPEGQQISKFQVPFLRRPAQETSAGGECHFPEPE